MKKAAFFAAGFFWGILFLGTPSDPSAARMLFLIGVIFCCTGMIIHAIEKGRH